MSSPDTPRRVIRGLRGVPGASGYDVSFAYLGTGFARTEAGRLFVPLIGGARLVPSPQEEMRWASAWPKWWQATAVFVACVLVGSTSVNGATLQGSILGALLFPGSPIAILIIWLRRERQLIASWQPLDAQGVGRTALVLDFLSGWSTLRLLAHLGCLLFFATFVLRPWNFLRWPFIPPIDQIGVIDWVQRSLAGALLLHFLFVLLRAAYWAIRALLNKWSLARGAA